MVRSYFSTGTTRRTSWPVECKQVWVFDAPAAVAALPRPVPGHSVLERQVADLRHQVVELESQWSSVWYQLVGLSCVFVGIVFCLCLEKRKLCSHVSLHFACCRFWVSKLHILWYFFCNVYMLAQMLCLDCLRSFIV